MSPDQIAAVAVRWWESLPASQRSPESLEAVVRVEAAGAAAVDWGEPEPDLAACLREARRLAGFPEEG